jgi:hypothetical protein
MYDDGQRALLEAEAAGSRDVARGLYPRHLGEVVAAADAAEGRPELVVRTHFGGLGAARRRLGRPGGELAQRVGQALDLGEPPRPAPPGGGDERPLVGVGEGLVVVEGRPDATLERVARRLVLARGQHQHAAAHVAAEQGRTHAVVEREHRADRRRAPRVHVGHSDGLHAAGQRSNLSKLREGVALHPDALALHDRSPGRQGNVVGHGRRSHAPPCLARGVPKQNHAIFASFSDK